MAALALDPQHKLQLLADALALEFSQSLASARCSAALRRLLPGLEYLSIAVSNPAQRGSIVASANCAAAGPTTLHLHDPQSSAVGRALARGQPLQTSLLNGTAATLVPAWSDVQQMVAHAPGVTHLLCVPFGAGQEGAACQQHSTEQGSGRGALLFGFSQPPALDSRRSAMLSALAQCLPEPMARLSADTLAFVNFATGSAAQCSCCCPRQQEEEGSEAPSSPCRDDDRGGGGDGGAGPCQALALPRPAPAAGLLDSPGPSTAWLEGSELDGKPSTKAATTARAAASAGLTMQWPSPEAAGAPPRFSKVLLALAEEQGEAIVQQSPLLLTFRWVQMEQEYGRWIARHYLKVDLLFSVLLCAALFIISFVQPYRLIDSAPASVLLGLGMVLPVVLAWISKAAYITWREWMVVLLRLYVIAFINLVSIRSYQAQLPAERGQQWTTFWMLTGAESLCITALGFPIRMQLHLPLQFTAMGVASWNLPKMCADCYPGADAGACFRNSAAMAAIFGYIAPTVGLRYIQQRSRSIFASQLRAAAAHEA